MAQQVISLGSDPFSSGTPKRWEGSILIDPSLVDGGGVAYLRDIFFQGATNDFRVLTSASQAGSLFTTGPDLTAQWETSAVAITLSEAGGDSIVIAGPNHTSGSSFDPTEPYTWVPSNYAAAVIWC